MYGIVQIFKTNINNNVIKRLKKNKIEMAVFVITTVCSLQ